ncbi:FtsX-like permease family protein [Brevibacillus sp. NPDC003359]|uniref:FtsX-like permease family protein n=1 Tax=unclassified Brevibacillus TaxID=2684853 RepID=UPI00368822E3
MTLFNVATRNVQRSFKHYLLYFISLVGSIIIFYTFVSLRYEPTIVKLVQESLAAEILLTGGALVLVLFITVFIMYSSHFFAHKRKNEMGLYLLLGLRKGQVGRMMLMENFVMGAMALLLGLAGGMLLSRMFVNILLAFVGMKVESSFSFSASAIVITVVAFLILIVITSFSGYRIVYRFSLLELFKAAGKKEKGPRSNVYLAMVGMSFLLFGYLILLLPLTPSVPWQGIPIPLLALVIILLLTMGTYLFIGSMIPTWLIWLRTKKSVFYRGTNLISISHLGFRLRTQINLMTMIVILIASILTVVGFTSSLYLTIEKQASSFSPVSYQLSNSTEEIDRQVEQLLTEKVGKDGIKFQKRVEVVNVTATPDSKLPLPKGYSPNFTVIAVTDYNTMLRLADKQEETIEKIALQHAVPVLDSEELRSEEIDRISGQTFSVQLGGAFEITADRAKTYAPMRSNEDILLVVNDATFDQMKKGKASSYNHLFQLKKDSPELAEAFMSLQDKFAGTHFISQLYFYNNNMFVTGLFLYVGLFLGLVFLAATGSILYFKQVAEAYADQEQFSLMKKIGMDKTQITQSISRQIMVIFGLPLLLGILHSIVVLRSYFTSAETGIAWLVLLTIVAYTVMYLIYYCLTVRTYIKVAFSNSNA